MNGWTRLFMLAFALSAGSFSFADNLGDIKNIKSYSFWRSVSAEWGFGQKSTRETVTSDDETLGITVGVGHQIGRGAVLLRYTHHTSDHFLHDFGQAVGCGIFDADRCVYKEAKYDEVGLIYRERPWRYLSWGLGFGWIKRTLEMEIHTEGPDDYYSTGEQVLDTEERAAIFYELMLQFPLHKRLPISIGLGLQGQYNKDFPTHGIMLTVQKGI